MPKPTLKDLAAELGVSPSTVSVALAGRPGVSEALRKRIIDYAHESGYVPDPAMRALAAYRSSRQEKPPGWETLAFIHNWPTSDSWRHHGWGAAFAGAQSEAHRLGMQLEDFWLGTTRKQQAALNRILEARGIIGCIFLTVPPHENLPPTSALSWNRLKGVCLGTGFLDAPTHFPSVVPDYYGNMLLALKKIKEKGHKRIGLAISRHHDIRTRGEWTAAFISQQRNFEAIYLYDTLDPAAFQKWLGIGRYDALLIVSRTIPESQTEVDSSLKPVVYAIHARSETHHPGIRHDPEKLGAAAVRSLYHRLLAPFDHRLEGDERITHPGTWVENAPPIKK